MVREVPQPGRVDAEGRAVPGDPGDERAVGRGRAARRGGEPAQPDAIDAGDRAGGEIPREAFRRGMLEVLGCVRGAAAEPGAAGPLGQARRVDARERDRLAEQRHDRRIGCGRSVLAAAASPGPHAVASRLSMARIRS